MPNLGAPELVIIILVIVGIPVLLAVVIVGLVRRTGPRPDPGPALAPPGWLADPVERHQYRYWDGTQWTAAVSDDGAESRDPL